MNFVVGRNEAALLLTAKMGFEVSKPRFQFAPSRVRHAVDKQNPVDMVILMLNDPGLQLVSCQLKFLSIEIERVDHDFF